MQANTIDTQLLSAVYAEVQQRFETFDDPAHGWEHIDRVYKLALHIAQEEGADPVIVGIAALTHDLGRLSRDHTKHHADLSVQSAAALLSAHQVAPHTQQAILHAIATHSFSLGVEPRTLEAKVMRDADRLDALGAIGIWRWAVTGAVRRIPQTQLYHPADPFAEQHTPDDHRYMLDHFFTKLLKLSETMHTRTGHTLAQQRTAFMQAYLDQLRSEIEILLYE